MIILKNITEENIIKKHISIVRLGIVVKIMKEIIATSNEPIIISFTYLYFSGNQ